MALFKLSNCKSDGKGDTFTMELKKTGVSEITVKMLTSGRYTWSITTTFETDKSKEAIAELKQIDQQLRDKFVDHVSRGSGRIASLDEE